MFNQLERVVVRRIFLQINVTDKKRDLYIKDLLEQIDTVFQDPCTKEKALSTLNYIKQENIPLNEFLSQFN